MTAASMTTHRRGLRRRWKPLLVVSAAIALLVGWYCWVIPVTISEVPPHTPVAEHYFCFACVEAFDASEESVKPRNILLATGRFFVHGRHLDLVLYLVENGNARELQSLGVGQSGGAIGVGLLGQRFTMRVALGDVDTPIGHLTILGVVGHRSGAGSGGRPITPVDPVASRVLTGRIYTDRPRIVYVEGDQTPIVDWSMTLDDFAARNSGRYLIVTACAALTHEAAISDWLSKRLAERAQPPVGLARSRARAA